MQMSGVVPVVEVLPFVSRKGLGEGRGGGATNSRRREDVVMSLQQGLP